MPKNSKKENVTIAKAALEEIYKSLDNIDGWGSIEVVIQDYKVTQVTEKNIRKPQFSANDRF